MKNSSSYLKVKEAADILNVSESTMRRIELSGLIESQRHPNNNYRLYKLNDIITLKEKFDNGLAFNSILPVSGSPKMSVSTPVIKNDQLITSTNYVINKTILLTLGMIISFLILSLAGAISYYAYDYTRFNKDKSHPGLNGNESSYMNDITDNSESVLGNADDENIGAEDRNLSGATFQVNSGYDENIISEGIDIIMRNLLIRDKLINSGLYKIDLKTELDLYEDVRFRKKVTSNDLHIEGQIDADEGLKIGGVAIFDDEVIINEDLKLNNDLILTDGKVGIGTENPQSELDVDGDIRLSGSIYTSGGEEFTTGQWIDGDGYIYPKNLGNGYELVLTDQGKLGLGTDSPDYLMDVRGDVGIGNGFDLYVGDIGLSDSGVSAGTSGANLIGVYSTGFSNSSGTNLQEVLGDFDSAIGSGGGGESVWDLNGSSTYYVDGNVGIGTSSPEAELDVLGNIKSSGVIEGVTLTDGIATLSNGDLTGLTSFGIGSDILLDLTGVGLTIFGGELTIDQSALSVENFTTSLSSGSVIFADSDSLTSDSANFFWDNTNKRLGIGTSAPNAILDISSNDTSVFRISRENNDDFTDILLGIYGDMAISSSNTTKNELSILHDQLGVSGSNFASLKFDSLSQVNSGSWTKILQINDVSASWSIKVDSIHDEIYVATNHGGDVYKCKLETGCASENYWTKVFDGGSENHTFVLEFDYVNGILYSGSWDNGKVYSCDTNSGCNHYSDWIQVYDSDTETWIRDIYFSASTNELFLGTAYNGKIIRCDVGTGCDNQSDWNEIYDSDAWRIVSLTSDSEHNVIYAGSYVPGNIYRCEYSTGCDDVSDWELVFTIAGSWVRSLVYDSLNSVIYAGTNNSGKIYSCQTSTECDEQADWIEVFDSPNDVIIMALEIDTDNGIIYAGSDSIYSCSTLTDCDEQSDWVLEYTPETTITSVDFSPSTGHVYALTPGIVHRRSSSADSKQSTYASINSIVENSEFGNEAGSLSFSVNRLGELSEILRINSNGHIGIGTTAPSTLLSLADTSYTFDSSGLSFGDMDTGIYESADDKLNFRTAGSDWFTVDASGNLGIGTTAPSWQLDMTKNVNGWLLAHVKNTNASGASNFTTANDIGSYISLVQHGSNFAGSLFGNDRAGTAMIYSQGLGDFVIGNYSNKNLVLGSNNTERMRITNTGKVGIGTTSPSTLLSLGNTEYSFNSGGLSLGDGDTGFYEIADDKLNIRTAGTDRITVDSSGNVGIGTSSPGAMLEVKNSGIVNLLRLGNVNDVTWTFTQNASGWLHLSPSYYYTALYVTGQGILSDTIWADSKGSASEPAFSFWSDLNTGIWSSGTDILNISTGGSERLRIDPSGNIGIGTTSPSTLLSLGNTSYTFSSGGLSFGDMDTGFYESADDVLNLRTVGVDRLTVDASGNVGIGTTSPSGKTEIVGSSDIKQLIIKANSTQTANLQEWQDSNGATKAYITGNGRFIHDYSISNVGPDYQIGYRNDDYFFGFNAYYGDTQFKRNGSVMAQFSPSWFIAPSTLYIGLGADAALSRDEANIIAQRLGVNPQEFRIYNTDSTADEFASLGFINNSNVFTIQTEQSGGGTVRPIALLGGSVGVGTSAPSTLLSLGNTDYTFTSGGLSFGDMDTGFYESADDVLNLRTGGTDRLTVNGSGNVGIGTTNPNESIETTGNIRLAFNQSINAKNTVNNIAPLIGLDGANYVNINDSFTASNGINLGGMSYYRFGGENASLLPPVAFGPNGDSTTQVKIYSRSATRRSLTIWKNPSQTANLFEWQDGSQIGLGAIDVNGRLGLGTTSPSTLLSLSNTDYTFASGGLSFGDMDTGFYESADDDLNLRTSGLDRFTVDASGNVGIGTTNPGYELELVGTFGLNGGLTFLGSQTIGTTTGDLQIYPGSGILRAGTTIGDDGGLYIRSNSVDVAKLMDTGLTNDGGLFLYNADGTTNNVLLRSDGNSFINGGNLGIGHTNPGYILVVDHNRDGANAAYVDNSNAWTSGSADYAEYFYTDDTGLEPGEVVCLDILNENQVKRCERERDINVIGVVSTSPAFLGNAPIEEDRENNPNYKKIAMLGQIPAKVSSENGVIRIGDSLTPSSTPGYVMKADAGDSTVAVALENQSSEDDLEVIQVLISRKNKSLTVESVEQQISGRIASMKIDDEINISLNKALQNFNLSADINFDELGNISVSVNDLTGRVVKLEDELMNLKELMKEYEISEEVNEIGMLVAKLNENDIRYADIGTQTSIYGVTAFNQFNEIEIKRNGIEMIKITNENGDIKKGDPITISKYKEGYGSKGIMEGVIVGYAISDSKFDEFDEIENEKITQTDNEKITEAVDEKFTAVENEKITAEENESFTVDEETSVEYLVEEIPVLVNITWYEGVSPVSKLSKGNITDEYQIDTGIISSLGSVFELVEDRLNINKDVTIYGSMNVQNEIVSGDITALLSLSVGLMNFNSEDNSINVLGGEPLKIQNENGSGDVEFFGGKVIMSNTGDIKIIGEIQAEKVKANEIETIDLDTEGISTNVLGVKDGISVGQGLIKSGETDLIIENSNVDSSSKIFLTPLTNTGNQMLIIGQKDVGKFVVKIEKPYSEDIVFDYWVIKVNL